MTAVYVDLLSKAIGVRQEEDPTNWSLVEDYVSALTGYQTHVRSGWADTDEDLVCAIRYDRALVRLCIALGADTSPERFAPPEAERARLEDRLANLGPKWQELLPWTRDHSLQFAAN